MADHSSPLEGEEENLLQSALSTAFTPALTVPKPQPESSPQAAKSTPPPPLAVDPTPSSSASTDESWKSEYESQVQSWRAQSAEAREKADKERARWEEIRALEKQEEWSGATKVGEMSSGMSLVPGSSPADVRDLVSGEQEAKGSTHTRHDAGDESKTSSQKWSDIPSDLTSSYPSLSFPSPSRPPSPTQSHRRHQPPTAHHDESLLNTQRSAPLPPSATLAIFDSSLPAWTRLGALASSLAINLLLPFVNGVMLGFGEIFAKNIVLGWLGWKVPGSGIANVGVKSTQGRR